VSRRGDQWDLTLRALHSSPRKLTFPHIALTSRYEDYHKLELEEMQRQIYTA